MIHYYGTPSSRLLERRRFVASSCSVKREGKSVACSYVTSRGLSIVKVPTYICMHTLPYYIIFFYVSLYVYWRRHSRFRDPHTHETRESFRVWWWHTTQEDYVRLSSEVSSTPKCRLRDERKSFSQPKKTILASDGLFALSNKMILANHSSPAQSFAVYATRVSLWPSDEVGITDFATNEIHSHDERNAFSRSKMPSTRREFRNAPIRGFQVQSWARPLGKLLVVKHQTKTKIDQLLAHLTSHKPTLASLSPCSRRNNCTPLRIQLSTFHLSLVIHSSWTRTLCSLGSGKCL
jgi:hypothetical protein